MKKISCILLALFIITSGKIISQEVLTSDPYDITYEPNVVLVKIVDEVELPNSLAKKNGKVSSGITSLDEIFTEYNIEVMERLFKNAKAPLQKKVFKDFQGNEHEPGRLDKIYRLKYEEDIDAKELAEILNQDENIEYAEPDYHFNACAVSPDDPLYVSGDQWHIDAVNAPGAWELTTGDTTQIIAIIDTGVDWDHPDLDDNIWRNWNEIPDNGIDDDYNGYIDDVRGWDFVNDDNDPNDDNSHGTHVAGIAAAEGDNGVGVCGINWYAKIMPIKMLQSSGRGSSSDLASAIEYASSNGATVINMSLGSCTESITVKIALSNAYAYAVLVAAAGNNSRKLLQEGRPSENNFPACYPFVIGVEASTSSNSRALFSNIDPTGSIEFKNQWGYNYEIKAPGVEIESTFPNAGYHLLSGTSMASPIVAGAVSLMKTYHPEQSSEELFARLIQGADNGVLNIQNTINYKLEPDLYYISCTIVDTLDGCDRDGVADAGETIEIFFTLKNAGGYVDSTWGNLYIREYEDKSVVTILDSTSYVGDISAYGILTSELDPIKVEIDRHVSNNRDIVFNYRIGHKNAIDKVGSFYLTIQNGIEYSGYYSGRTILKPFHFYIITGNTVFDSLTIEPGTTIRFNDKSSILTRYDLVCKGKSDSMITFTINDSGYWLDIRKDGSNQDMEYCIFEYSDGRIINMNVKNSIFRYNKNPLITYNYAEIYNCVFDNNKSMVISNFNGSIKYNLFMNTSNWDAFAIISLRSMNNLVGNSFIDNTPYALGHQEAFFDVIELEQNYWGTEDSVFIESQIYDFFEDANKPIIVGAKNRLDKPSDLVHGHIWRVLINGIDPQDEHLDPLGTGRVKFEVYFNRAMDITVKPFLTFGVREPYTQHVVSDNALWSADSTIWTAYYDFGLETGDGINTIRVQGAEDNEHFEIPIEDSRFKFTLQAAGAAAIEFIANAGIGEVELEWPYANTDDILGYNMYRYYMVNDSTSSDTTLLNTSLITDSVYVDYNVIPDTTYGYLYKVLGTDMVESDYSKTVRAKPFNASNGDANGDLEVNVLDITAIVSYLLNKNPEPFLTEAGDVNDDGNINVLDIVAAVNIIMGDKIVAKTYAVNGDPILEYSQEGVTLSNGANICAMQITAVGQGINNAKLIPSELLKRMEYAYNIANDTLYVVIFSLGNYGIGNDAGQLFSLTEGKITEISEVTAANKDSELLSITVSNGSELIPEEYQLLQNYPNPFNPNTTIKFGLPIVSDVEINIYNILGQRIKSYYLQEMTAGFHSVMWNSTNDHNRKISTGVYIYQIKAGTFIDAKKMILLK